MYHLVLETALLVLGTYFLATLVGCLLHRIFISLTPGRSYERGVITSDLATTGVAAVTAGAAALATHSYDNSNKTNDSYSHHESQITKENENTLTGVSVANQDQINVAETHNTPETEYLPGTEQEIAQERVNPTQSSIDFHENNDIAANDHRPSKGWLSKVRYSSSDKAKPATKQETKETLAQTESRHEEKAQSSDEVTKTVGVATATVAAATTIGENLTRSHDETEYSEEHHDNSLDTSLHQPHSQEGEEVAQESFVSETGQEPSEILTQEQFETPDNSFVNDEISSVDQKPSRGWLDRIRFSTADKAKSEARQALPQETTESSSVFHENNEIAASDQRPSKGWLSKIRYSSSGKAKTAPEQEVTDTLNQTVENHSNGNPGHQITETEISQEETSRHSDNLTKTVVGVAAAATAASSIGEVLTKSLDETRYSEEHHEHLSDSSLQTAHSQVAEEVRQENFVTESISENNQVVLEEHNQETLQQSGDESVQPPVHVAETVETEITETAVLSESAVNQIVEENTSLGTSHGVPYPQTNPEDAGEIKQSEVATNNLVSIGTAAGLVSASSTSNSILTDSQKESEDETIEVRPGKITDVDKTIVADSSRTKNIVNSNKKQIVERNFNDDEVIKIINEEEADEEELLPTNDEIRKPLLSTKAKDLSESTNWINKKSIEFAGEANGEASYTNAISNKVARSMKTMPNLESSSVDESLLPTIEKDEITKRVEDAVKELANELSSVGDKKES